MLGLWGSYTDLQNFTEGHCEKSPKKQRDINPVWGSDTGGLSEFLLITKLCLRVLS